MQGAGRISGNEFDLDFLSGADRGAAEIGALSKDACDASLMCFSLQEAIDESGAGNFGLGEIGRWRQCRD